MQEFIKLLGLLAVLLPAISKSKWISQHWSWAASNKDMIEVAYIVGVAILFLLVLCNSFIGNLIRKYIFKNWDISLLYNVQTGILRDVKTGNRNVSLRDKTVKKILKAVTEDKWRGLGKEIGTEFWSEYVAGYAKSEQLLSLIDKIKSCLHLSSQHKILAKRWSKYDSTSGMGKFNMKELSEELAGNLKVTNPFTEDECIKFIEGYIEGVLCKITSESLTVEFKEYKGEEGLPTATFLVKK